MGADKNEYNRHVSLFKTGTTQKAGTTHELVYAEVLSPLENLLVTAEKAKGFAPGASDEIRKIIFAVNSALEEEVSILDESNSSNNSHTP